MAALLDPIVGLRVDGRKPNELRKIKCEVGVFAQADGSASLSQVEKPIFLKRIIS